MTEQITDPIEPQEPPVGDPPNTPPEPTPEEVEARQQVETEARKYGWRPKEDFTLAPDNWVDADRFMEFPQTQNKMLRDEMKDLRSVVEAKDAEIEKVQHAAVSASRQIEGLVRSGVERELAAIQAQQREAVEAADTEAFEKLEQQKQQVIQQGHTPQRDPQVEAYYNDPKNEWAKNPVLWQQARDIVSANPAVMAQSGLQQIQYAEGQMRKMYPAYFAAPEPDPKPNDPPPPPKVDPGGTGGIWKTGNSAADLPADAKAAGTEFVKEGLFKSLDDYAAKYFAEGN